MNYRKVLLATDAMLAAEKRGLPVKHQVFYQAIADGFIHSRKKSGRIYVYEGSFESWLDALALRRRSNQKFKERREGTTNRSRAFSDAGPVHAMA